MKAIHSAVYINKPVNSCTTAARITLKNSNKPPFFMSGKVSNWFKEKARQAKYQVTRKSEAEKAFLECTNDEKWGPSNTQMQEVVRYSHNYKDWDDIKHLMVELFDEGAKKVRCLKKGLMLLEYLITNGGDNMRSEARMFTGTLQGLCHLHQNTTGEKAAIEAVIRKKAQDILNLMNDDDLYQMEREKARKLKASLSSVTHDEYGGSYQSSTYGDTYGYGRDDYDDRRYQQEDRAAKYAPKSNSYHDRQGGGMADPGEYYSDDEPAPSAPPQRGGQFNPFQDNMQQSQPQQPQANPFGQPQPQQQQFNPFTQQQPQQQANPFAQQQQQQQQQPQPENPFAPRQQQSAQPFNPFAQQRMQQQQQPQPQQSAGMDLLSGFGASQPVQQQQVSADDLLFGMGSAQPQQPRPQQPMPVQQQAPMDLLDFTAAAPAQPMAQPMAQAPAQQRKGPGMLDEFGDLVNLDLGRQQERRYGAAGMQQRGAGQTLGGGYRQ